MSPDEIQTLLLAIADRLCNRIADMGTHPALNGDQALGLLAAELRKIAQEIR